MAARVAHRLYLHRHFAADLLHHLSEGKTHRSALLLPIHELPSTQLFRLQHAAPALSCRRSDVSGVYEAQ